MGSHNVLLLAFLCGACQAYNIETRFNLPLNLRDGGTNSGKAGQQNDTSFAAYSFDAVVDNGVMKLIVGQPRDGNNVESRGAIYFCNVTFTAASDGPIPSASADPENSANLTCEEAKIYDQNNVNQRGTDHRGGADALGLSVARIGTGNEYMICTPTRQRKCGKRDVFSPGACYTGNAQHEYWNYDEWPEAKCFQETVGVMFVVDGSLSIGEFNFNNIVKPWLVNVTRSLIDTFGDSVRTQVLQYADRSQIEIPYQLGECVTVECVIQKVEGMKYLKGQTYTNAALKRVLTVEFDTPGWYNVSTKIIVVLTDGEANDGAHLSTTHNNNKDKATFFAVGVGNYENFTSQLKKIANGGESDDRVLTVDSFTLLESVIGTLAAEIENSVSLEGAEISGNASDDFSPQLGSSIASTKTGTSYIGAVGMYQGTGTVLKYDDSADKIPDVPTYQEIQTVLQSDKVTASYFGYAMTTGFFEGRDSIEYVAVGAPRHMMIGAVVIYRTFQNNSTLGKNVKITAPAKTVVREPNGSTSFNSQFGSYFGGSVLAMDLNNDERDDLLVGAPLYIGNSYDEGRVFAYISNKSSSYQEWSESEPLELYGENLPGGRFGTAISNAGDLNSDGYNDVLIGAPLTEEGRGAIFIYHGSAGGIDVVPKQKILASTLGGRTLQYFGQSLQGSIDLNGDHYPDILVGAPKSDYLVILKSRPIVKIFASIDFTTTDISIIGCMEKNYQNCTRLRICFTVNGTSIERKIAMQYNVTIDSSNSSSRGKRFYFRRQIDSSGTGEFQADIEVPANDTVCFEEPLSMKETSLDYSTAIVAKLEYNLTPVHLEKPFSSVRDLSQPTSPKWAILEFVNECEAEVCVHDLGISTSLDLPKFSDKNFTATLIIDTSTKDHPPEIIVNLTNIGEMAFNTQVKVTYSRRIGLSSVIYHIAHLPSSKCVVTEGDPLTIGTDSRAQIFSYNSPKGIMPPNSWCYFSFNLTVDSLRTDATTKSLFVSAIAYTSSNSSIDNNTADNSREISFNVNYISDLVLIRENGDKVRTFNDTATIEKNITSVEEIGRGLSDIDMKFKVTETGYSTLPMAKITLTWPWMSEAGDPLLYLFDLVCEPVGTTTGTTCSCDRTNLDPYNLTDSHFENNRTIAVSPATSFINDTEIDCYSEVPSHNHTCKSTSCVVTNLSSLAQLRFSASFRLWIASITFEGANYTQLNLKSRFQMSTEGSPLALNRDGENVTIKATEITTTAKKLIISTPPPATDRTWILIVATAGGLLLLVLAVALLWRLGFFKSKFARLLESAEQDLAENEEDDINSDFESLAKRLRSFSGNQIDENEENPFNITEIDGPTEEATGSMTS